MGTSLFGLKPKNTYQGLLKTTDNSAIGATNKFVSDGLGNDSALSLSTSLVGIGTTSPTARLQVNNATNGALISRFKDTLAATTYIDFKTDPTLTDRMGIYWGSDYRFLSKQGASLFINCEYNAVFANGLQAITTITPSEVQVGTISGARLGVKGSGATSATTSLLVQNSAGTASLTVKDDGSISGGTSSIASSSSSISLGNSNTASGGVSLSLGGSVNIASGTRSVTLAGEGNTANNTSSSVLGSMYSTASGIQSMVLNSVSGNTASGANSMVINKGNASGTQSIAFNDGGTSAGLSIAFNTNSRAVLYNQFAISNGVNISGGSQASQLVSSKNDTLTTGGTTVLSLDGTGLTNLIIPNISATGSANRAWNVQVNWVAAVTAITGTATGISVGDVITSIDLLAFKRILGTSSASSHTSTATKTMVTTPAAYAASAINYTAGASQEMALTFTGPTFLGGGSVTMRIVARVELSEVAWT